ncbi:MAG: ABC transporter permease [Dehalococcoidia bacterium]
MRYRSLPVIAVRRMLGNWRLLASVVVGTVVAATIIASTAIYADAIRDLGLRYALAHHDRAALDVVAAQNTVVVDRPTYQGTRNRVDRAVAGVLGDAAGAHVRQITSATLFPTPRDVPLSTADNRPRAYFRVRSDYEDHVRVVEGAFPAPLPHAEWKLVPVAVGLETAQRNGIHVGDVFDLYPFWDAAAKPVPVEVAGLIAAVDPTEPYWGGDLEAIDHAKGNWETFDFYIPEATLFGAISERLPGIQGDLLDRYTVDIDRLDARQADVLAAALEESTHQIEVSEPRLRVRTDLIEVLRTFDTKLFFTRIPLLIFLLQVVGIVAYYLVMVSGMLVERQASEIALQRSRGATTGQLLAQYAIEGFILAGLATVVGPPLAAAVIAALGPIPAFAALSGGGLLRVGISSLSYALAAGGAAVAFAALMIPAWRVTSSTMVEFKRAAARPRVLPFFLRYYLDVALVAFSGIVFWRLSQQEGLFATSIAGDVQSDPLLLLTPAVFLLTVAVLFLRLFPLALRAIAIVLGLTGNTAVLVGMRALVRNPTHYTHLVLLLMFATGVGTFAASFSETLTGSYEHRAAYAVGADVRAADFRGLTRAGDASVRATFAALPSERQSPVLRTSASITAPGGQRSVQLVGIDPTSFPGVAFFRGDFAPTSLKQIAGTLADNGVHEEGFAVPGTPRQLGAWVKAPTISGLIDVAVRVRDNDGRYLDVTLGSVQPQQDVVTTWRFLAAAVPGADRLTPPLEVMSYYFVPRGGIASTRGTIFLGPVLASDDAPEANAVLGGPRPSEFTGARTIEEFRSIEGLQAIQGLRPVRVADRPVASNDAPPGHSGALSYSWVDDRRGPALRGVQRAVTVPPMKMHLLRSTAADLGLTVGDTFQVLAQSRYIEGELAGVFDYFPTARVDSDAGFGVVDLDRLLYGVNAPPGQGGSAPNEVWLGGADPSRVRAAIGAAGLAPQLLLDVESERFRQQEDPLVAAGWQGILFIAFGAVLLLSAIGFLVYSYLTAQERSLEFAILRTLGFSGRQIFGVVAFEHVFVIVTGMGLGTGVGLQVGRIMLRFLGTDEQGATVVPPLQLGVSWPAVALAWGILGTVFAATIGAVVLLYVRLQVHRALRIGDV